LTGFFIIRGVLKMYYESTRGGLRDIPPAEAIKRGLAPDGGLFVPQEEIVFEPEEIYRLAGMNYMERAVFILGRFLDDYSREELEECVKGAYGGSRFENGNVAPVGILNGNAYVLELWHGPTCAFKDVALQLLPHLLTRANRKTGDFSETVILVATSGDTGKAALEGFKDVDGTRIIVFFPEDGVSQVQKMQMVTQEGGNVYSITVQGNFDDTQNGVKAIFSDADLRESMQRNGFKFSSANSINWGRLVPQIVYYFSAYADLLAAGEITEGEKINFTVPTGNFGNILAAWYARAMGLPVGKLICASNENNVLTEFINTGVYDRNRELKKTISPSMDILISSNLERLLFELNGHDGRQVLDWMTRLRDSGKYEVNAEVKQKVSEMFWGTYTTEAETMKTIKAVYVDYGYVVDTHTAVGIDAYDKYVIASGDMTKTVIVSTASPFKFAGSVVRAIFGEEAALGASEFELTEMLAARCGLKIPAALDGLSGKKVLHNTVCKKEEMKDMVLQILNMPYTC
jgi:threonine synthase